MCPPPPCPSLCPTSINGSLRRRSQRGIISLLNGTERHSDEEALLYILTQRKKKRISHDSRQTHLLLFTWYKYVYIYIYTHTHGHTHHMYILQLNSELQ